MADLLHRKSSHQTSTGAVTVDTNSLHTIFDTTQLESQSAYGACVIKCILAASASGNLTFSLYVEDTLGERFIVAPKQATGDGFVWSSNPEGFINLMKGDKLKVFFDGAPAGLKVDFTVSYLYTTND